jgi:tetratricopeptide (TPR) repeat protein
LAVLGAFGCAYFNTLYNANRLYAEAQEIPRGRDGTATSGSADKYEKVIAKCEAVIASYPDSKHVDNATLLIGKCLYEIGDYGGAIQRLSVLDTLSTDPKVKAEGRLVAAKSYIARDETDMAIPLLQEAVGEDPKRASGELLFYLGTALVKSGDEDTAVKYLEQLAVNYPNSVYRVAADLEVAELYVERGEYEKSLAVYGRLARVSLEEADQIRFLVGLGRAHTENGDYEEAIAVYRRLDDYIVDPTVKAEYLLVKARAYAGTDSLATAIDTYKTIAASYPRSIFSAEAHYRLGGIYQDKLDSLQLAQQEFDRVAGEYAGSPYASESIASSSAIAKMLRLNAALATGGDAGDQAAVQFDLAEIELLQFKNYEKALAGYRKVLEDYPDNELAPRAAYAIAYVYDAVQGDTTNAVPAYELVAARYPYTQQGQFAREALARLGHPVAEPPPRAEEPKTAAPMVGAAADTTGALVPAKAAGDSAAAGARSTAAGDSTAAGGQSKAASDSAAADGQSKAASDSTAAGAQSKAASDSTTAGAQSKADGDSTSAGGRTPTESDTTRSGTQGQTESDTTKTDEKPETP